MYKPVGKLLIPISYYTAVKQNKKIYLDVLGPTSMYKRPITCSMDYGFWKDDSALKNQNWYSKLKHLPRKASERTR